MSDDHHNQKGNPPNHPDHSGGGDEEYDDDAKTQLVDLDSIRGGDSEPQFAPPPTMGDSDGAGGENQPDPDDAKTELFEVPSSMQQDGDAPFTSSDDGAITSSAPSVGDSSFDSTSGGVSGGVGAQTPGETDDGDWSSVGGDSPGGGVSSSAPSSSEQVYIGGDGAGHDGATQFINVNDFADQHDAHFTPEQEEAGYDGSTQFVDVNALQAGAEQIGGDPIDNDRELHRGYQFDANDIQRGDFTLIEAQNPLGKDVILKRIWEGEPHEMNTPLRDRIAQLNELAHPNLLSMNGMFVTESGMWIELDTPSGQRLTDILQQHGPLAEESVLQWTETIADVLKTVHAEHLAYANLTTDTIWIDEDGTVRLEPFDMLRLEDRGNLGVFGPPEMNAPPDARQLSPATDVYSLAAVVGAAITGLPLKAENFEAYDNQKLIGALSDALVDDPTARPADVDEFLEQLHGGSDGIDIKIVGGVVFSILFLCVAVLATIAGDDPDPEATASEQHVDQQAVDQQAIDEQAADQQLAELDDPPAEPTDPPDEPDGVELPDQISEDPRLTIITSFEHNPPGDAAVVVDDDQLQQWREDADQHRAEGEDADEDERFDHYEQALQLLVDVIHAQQTPSEDDLDAWRDLYTEEVVQQEVDDLLDSIGDNLADGRVGSAARSYRSFAAINPHAEAAQFFRDNENVEAIEPERIDNGEDDDE